MTETELAPAISASGAGSRLTLHVVPRASRTELAGLHGPDALRVRLAAPPVDGKANREVVRFFADLAGLPARDVLLVSGQTGRRKTLSFPALPPAELARRLAR